MKYRVRGVRKRLSDAQKEDIKRRAEFSLRRHSDRIRRTTVTIYRGDLRDDSSLRCRIRVRGQGGWTVTIDENNLNLAKLLDDALYRAGTTVERRLSRMRERPRMPQSLRKGLRQERKHRNRWLELADEGV